jgi:glycosyltransferase involved in cell wall biosynthesis
MSCSVIVTTYNDPGKLALVLAGLARQSVMPREIIVADDGSRQDTGDLVRAWAAHMPVPLLHVWHEDRGFRKMRICNLAVLRSSGERIVFLDGDSIPHSRWVEDHDKAHLRADVLCGRRVKLGPRLTERVDATMVQNGGLERLFSPVLSSFLSRDTERWSLGLRFPAWFARLLHPRPRKLMGVNFSVTRRAFEAVNGYDHDAPAKREDRELELRLLRGGHSFAPLLNRAIVYHLHHPFAPASAEGEALLLSHERASHVRCPNGLDEVRNESIIARALQNG